MKIRMLPLLLALLPLPSLALAATTVRPWLAGGLAGSMYSMSDVNSDIGDINAVIAPTGLRMDTIDKGLGFGASAGVEFPSGLAVGLGYDRLAAHSDVADPSASLTYDFPANLIRGVARYEFKGSPKAHGFLEGSVGRISSAGTVSMSITGEGSVSGDVEGSGLAFEGGGGAEIWASPQFAFTGAVGFRHATIGEVTVHGQRIYNANGSDYALDYSGVFVRLGVLVALVP